ncbi:MAG TPA: sigma 54-interacting transcriptional regulator [Pyrinomonadaceae bacterium]|jgi:DNA-binding NtrC family response regulator
MTTALFAPSEFPAAEVATALRREGLRVSPVGLGEKVRAGGLPEDVAGAVLIQTEQGVIALGEQTSRVRAALGEGRPMLLCCPQPTPVDRETLIECGASDVVTPSSWAPQHVAERILAEFILCAGDEAGRCGTLYGGTQVMRRLYGDLATVAPLDDPVLVLGESGTGKELVARELHRQSGRQDIFLPINCAELSQELLGSELFGHEKGAFTNALHARKGLLAEAHDGTVFLDEIGELDPQAQAKLLRVIEDRKVRPVGSNHWEEVGARLILATNRDLEEECQVGRFRPDLLERIRGFTLVLPPLRARKADIPLLAHRFVAEYGDRYGRELGIPAGAVDFLFRYDWEGNIRELRAAVRKAAAYADERGNISAVMLQEAVRGRKKNNAAQHSVPFDPAVDTWRDVQKRAQAAYLRAVLAVTNGNKESAAKLSGISRAQLYEKLKELD